MSLSSLSRLLLRRIILIPPLTILALDQQAFRAQWEWQPNTNLFRGLDAETWGIHSANNRPDLKKIGSDGHLADHAGILSCI